MEKNQVSTNSNTAIRFKEPPLYNVIMHNDDYTTMDFVVMLLKRVFRKSEEDAVATMLKIHNEGSAIVGTYSYDIAKSKVALAERYIYENEFPLQLTIEEA